jgi:hypothetical protein
MSPSDRVAQLYPQALGSLFVTFHNSQGYGGGILTCLHTLYPEVINMREALSKSLKEAFLPSDSQGEDGNLLRSNIAQNPRDRQLSREGIPGRLHRTWQQPVGTAGRQPAEQEKKALS